MKGQLFATLFMLTGIFLVPSHARCGPNSNPNEYRTIREGNYYRNRNNRQLDYKGLRNDNGVVYFSESLAPNFIGSGTSDFAFPGDSFRPFSASAPQNIKQFEDGWQGRTTNNKIINYNDIELTTSMPRTTSTFDRRPNLCQLSCHKTITHQYSPICGSDGVTYYNAEKFRCATKCGKAITGKPNSCGPNAPLV